jgi:hypothetical protein
MQRPISAAGPPVLVRFRTGNISVGWVLGSFDNGVSYFPISTNRDLAQKLADQLQIAAREGSR